MVAMKLPKNGAAGLGLLLTIKVCGWELAGFFPLVLAVVAEPGLRAGWEWEADGVKGDQGCFSGAALEGDFGGAALGAAGLGVGRGLAAVVDDFRDGRVEDFEGFKFVFGFDL